MISVQLLFTFSHGIKTTVTVNSFQEGNNIYYLLHKVHKEKILKYFYGVLYKKKSKSAKLKNMNCVCCDCIGHVLLRR